jgi:gas vesicle protein
MHTGDKIVELPLGLMTMGLIAAVVVVGTQRRRERTTEPTSWQHAMEHPPV